MEGEGKGEAIHTRHVHFPRVCSLCYLLEAAIHIRHVTSRHGQKTFKWSESIS